MQLQGEAKSVMFSTSSIFFEDVCYTFNLGIYYSFNLDICYTIFMYAIPLNLVHMIQSSTGVHYTSLVHVIQSSYILYL